MPKKMFLNITKSLFVQKNYNLTWAWWAGPGACGRGSWSSTTPPTVRTLTQTSDPANSQEQALVYFDFKFFSLSSFSIFLFRKCP